MLNDLKAYLNQASCPNVQIWDDGQIEPGVEWDQNIKHHLSDADIILLLISQYFLNSEYIQSNELSVALKRHESKECRVIPIFTRTCSLKGHPQITKLQGLPQGMKFLSEIEERSALYTRIQEDINEIADELLIVKSTPSTSDNLDAAKDVEHLRNNQKIFLSVPMGEEGRKRRKEFLYQVEGKIKYEGWPYQVVPTIKEVDELLLKDEPSQHTLLSNFISESIYSIHILETEKELEGGLGKMQYNQSKSTATIFKSAIWLLKPDILDKVKDDLRTDIRMNPIFSDNNFETLFQIIAKMDKEKEKKITALKSAILPSKKVFMFYDFSKDHTQPLRIDLKKKMEEFQISVRLNSPNDSVEKGKELLEKCDGALIFYGQTDSQWYLMRQSLLFDANHLRSKAICVDEPDIERKVNDIASEFITIRGKQDLDVGVQNIIQQLKA